MKLKLFINGEYEEIEIGNASIVELVVRGYDVIVKKDKEVVLSQGDARKAFNPPYFSNNEEEQ